MAGVTVDALQNVAIALLILAAIVHVLGDRDEG